MVEWLSHHRRCVVFLALLSGHIAELSAAPMPERSGKIIERVPLDQGAALHLTYCILQTRDGFLWFGTMYGLIRYDGYSYIAYRHDPADTSSLSNDDIVTLHEDSGGDLWVGTYGGGLNRFDRSTGGFERFSSWSPDIIWGIREGIDGNIWVASETHGIMMLDRKSGEIVHFTHDPQDTMSLAGDRVSSIERDTEGNIWGATNGGLCMIDPLKKKVMRQLLGTVQGVPVIPHSLFLDRKGTLWVGTANHGVGCLELSESLPTRRYKSKPMAGVISSRVNTLIAGTDEQIIAGTNRGVFVLGGDGSTVERYTHDPKDQSSLYSNEINSLCLDQSGILWVGSYAGGIAKVHSDASRFSTYLSESPEKPGSVVFAILPTDTSTIFASTSTGLFEIDKKRDLMREILLKDVPGTRPGMIRSLFRDQQGDLWLGTVAGLHHLTPNWHLKKTYRHSPLDSLSISSDVVLKIMEDHSGDLWLGTAGGLNCLDRGTGRFTRYTAGGNGLKHDFVLALFEDSQGSIWVGTYGGTSVLQQDRLSFKHYLQSGGEANGISSNYALSFCETPDGSVWIGTGGGLNKFDRRSKSFTHFLPRHGLPNGVVTGILPIGDGVLWLSTHFGLSRFNTEARSFSNYDKRDGIAHNMFLTGASGSTADGHLFFGGLGGVTVLRDSGITLRQFSPHVALTHFNLLKNRNAATSDESIKHGLLFFSHDQNYFTIEFASLDYLRPSKNLYSYFLEGFDEDWVASGNRRTATYTDVPPGEYLFRVRGTNADGVWSTHEAVLGLTIHPPFWQTWWFLTLCALTFVFLLILLHGLRVKRNLSREREREQIRQQAAETIRKAAARDFHDELGHRLTKIGLFAELVRKRISPSSSGAIEHVDKIIESSQALTEDTRNFLWALDPGKDSLYDLLLYVNTFGEDLFDRTGITFHSASPSEEMMDLKLTMDYRRHLALILKEAMNNALKHARCSNIILMAEVRNGSILLVLSDDGQGYLRKSEREGNGLRNMRMRAERIHGAIEIESEPGQGTRVRFASMTA